MKKITKIISSTFIFREKLSLGRLMLFSVFILSMFKWYIGVDIPQNMLTIEITLLAYILGGKVIKKSDETQKEETK